VGTGTRPGARLEPQDNGKPKTLEGCEDATSTRSLCCVVLGCDKNNLRNDGADDGRAAVTNDNDTDGSDSDGVANDYDSDR
jgi:hypothetical protein